VPLSFAPLTAAHTDAPNLTSFQSARFAPRKPPQTSRLNGIRFRFAEPAIPVCASARRSKALLPLPFFIFGRCASKQKGFQKSAPQVSTAPKLALAHNGSGFATGCLLRIVPLGVALPILTALV